MCSLRFRRPPKAATRLLERITFGPTRDAIVGDLIEQYQHGRSRGWFWRQALLLLMMHTVWDWLTTTVRETAIMRRVITLGAATMFLLIVDWFTFHDFREPHTVRDYLTLLASILVCFDIGLELLGKLYAPGTNMRSG
jgi:hypothetical protein